VGRRSKLQLTEEHSVTQDGFATTHDLLWIQCPIHRRFGMDPGGIEDRDVHIGCLDQQWESRPGRPDPAGQRSHPGIPPGSFL